VTESELLTIILEKPALYVEYGSVSRIFAFLEGYTLGRQQPSDLTYRGFGQWLRKCFGIRQDLNWASIISFVGRSEAGAFDLAKEMWPRYLQEVRDESNEI